MEGDEGCDLGHSGTLEAEERPGRKSQRTLRNTPVGQPYLRALDDRCQPGVPPTDDFGGPLGKGVLSATAESNTAVPVGPPRPSSITHPEAAPATVTCSYIVAGTDGFLAGVIWYTTRRRRSDPPWGTHGSGGVQFPYFFPWMAGHPCLTLHARSLSLCRPRPPVMDCSS